MQIHVQTLVSQALNVATDRMIANQKVNQSSLHIPFDVLSFLEFSWKGFAKTPIF
jgi:hypothetical protein